MSTLEPIPAYGGPLDGAMLDPSKADAYGILFVGCNKRPMPDEHKAILNDEQARVWGIAQKGENAPWKAKYRLTPAGRFVYVSLGKAA